MFTLYIYAKPPKLLAHGFAGGKNNKNSECQWWFEIRMSIQQTASK